MTLLVEAALSARGDPGAPVDGKRLGDLTTRLATAVVEGYSR